MCDNERNGPIMMKTKKTFLCFCAILLFSLTLSGVSSGFNEKDVEKLRKTKECQWCALNGANLTGASLAHGDLSGANLSEAKLVGADLTGTDLSSAYLKRADLTDAKLSDAYFKGANLTGAKLDGADLTGADFSGAIWTDGTKCHSNSYGKCLVPNLLGAYE